MGRGIDGLHIFKEKKDKKEFLIRIKERLAQSSLQVYAWCLMENHFHFLIQTGETPMAEFMRSIMTGYAIYYNKTHKRRGHLFQNRYKSILCETDAYLLKLISYIHLNPVKANVVSFGKLKQYAWTGHKELMIVQEKGVIDRDEVLGFFGRTEKQAIEAYKDYLMEELDSDDDLTGGGLIRSLGGMTETMKVKRDEKQMYDERILGSGDFVEDVLSRMETEETRQRPFRNIEALLTRLALYYGVCKEEILNSRTKAVREAREVFIYLGNAYLGASLTTLGKLLKVSQSAASQARQKGRQLVKIKELVRKLAELE